LSTFEKIKADFNTNWTTLLVGWNGLGVFSPWPDRADEFPPLLSADEMVAYANERLALSSSIAEQDLIVKLLSFDLRQESREAIRGVLTQLSNLLESDSAFELRKWRVVLLEELLDDAPTDALYGLTALTEFWQGFGFPSDSPHEVQGRENEMTPFEYYGDQNWKRLLNRHRAWIQDEKSALHKQDKTANGYTTDNGSTE